MTSAQFATRPAPNPAQIEARWLSAFRRAGEYGITPRRLTAEQWAVASASSHPVVYIVAGTPDGLTCTCPAHTSGNVACWHKAAVCSEVDRHKRAYGLTDPEPPTGGSVVVAA